MKGVSVLSILHLKERNSKSKITKAPAMLDAGNCSVWYQGDTMQRVDYIDVEFINKNNNPGSLGSIELSISLIGSEKFVAPFVSTSDTANPSDPLPEYIEVDLERSDSVLVLKFQEPPEGKPVYYPNIYFYTSGGVVDPGVSIRREPPT